MFRPKHRHVGPAQIREVDYTPTHRAPVARQDAFTARLERAIADELRTDAMSRTDGTDTLDARGVDRVLGTNFAGYDALFADVTP